MTASSYSVFLARLSARVAVGAIALVLLAWQAASPWDSQAVIEQIYTLPFEGQYSITCAFGCYSGHEGTDYKLGNPDVGDHPVLAAKRGTVKLCQQFPTGAGYYIVLDHGNGHHTRYLHLASRVVSNGQVVERGAVIGYEGMTGTDNNHLHFETRHNATSLTCLNGTAVDPYYAGTYMWKTNPPSMRGADFSGDGCPDVLARASAGGLFRYDGNCAGGWDTGYPVDITAGVNWNQYNWLLRPRDFSGDGCEDVLARKPNGWLYRYDGHCDGGRLTGQPVALSGGWAYFTWIVGVGDFSGDGCHDLIVRKTDGKLYLYRGDCAGFFKAGPGGVIPNTGGWNGFDWILGPGDFSGDGCADVVARHGTDDQLYLYHGNCAGSFQAGTGDPIPNTDNWDFHNWILGLGDFSGGECADVVARHGTQNTLHLYHGVCAGTFGTGTGGEIGHGWGGYDSLFY